jgi:hypothetical protein
VVVRITALKVAIGRSSVHHMSAMTQSIISVHVPSEEASVLSELLELAGLPPAPDVTTRPFDGQAMAQVLLPCAATIIPVLTRWIYNRRRARSSYRIFVDGIELTGYTAREARLILERLSERRGDTSGVT